MSGGLHACCTGEGGSALVLLHGLAGSHRAWAGVRERLGGVRILAYDLPGHGGSLDFPEAGPATVAARAVLADLDARAVERFHLAGHSFGGAVAALMALAAPQRVRSLALLAPGGFGPHINAPLLERFIGADNAAALRDSLCLMSGRRPAIDEGALREVLAMRAVPGQQAMLQRICGLIVRDGRQGVLPRDRLAALPVPVHVAWGLLDTVLPVAQARDLPAHFTAHLYPDLGHMLPEEAPQDMAALLDLAIRQADGGH